MPANVIINEGIKDDILDRTLVFLYEDSFPVPAAIGALARILTDRE